MRNSIRLYREIFRLDESTNRIHTEFDKTRVIKCLGLTEINYSQIEKDMLLNSIVFSLFSDFTKLEVQVYNRLLKFRRTNSLIKYGDDSFVMNLSRFSRGINETTSNDEIHETLYRMRCFSLFVDCNSFKMGTSFLTKYDTFQLDTDPVIVISINQFFIDHIIFNYIYRLEDFILLKSYKDYRLLQDYAFLEYHRLNVFFNQGDNLKLQIPLSDYSFNKNHTDEPNVDLIKENLEAIKRETTLLSGFELAADKVVIYLNPLRAYSE